MKLSSTERDILGRVSLNADKSLPELARLAGRKIHTVRYAIAKMEERNVIKKAWIIDVFRLGWQRFQLLVAIGGGNRKRFISYLVGAPHIAHIAEIGGQYDLDVAIIARTSDEALAILRKAVNHCGAVLRNKAVTAQSTIHYFPRKYMCVGKPTLGSIVVGENKNTYQLSPIEDKFLKAIIAKPEITRKDLSEFLEISLPTVDNRFKRLREEGVIRGAIYSSRYVEVGMQNYKILITMAGTPANLEKKILSIVHRHQHCTSFREGVGAWDFEVNVEIEKYQQITELKDLLWNEFGQYVHSIDLIPRFKLHFYSSYPVSNKDSASNK